MLKGHVANYLKKHTRLLIQDVGVQSASRATAKSAATLSRYCSDAPDNIERFIPIDAVVRLEIVTSQPFLTLALAELRGLTIDVGKSGATMRALEMHTAISDLSDRFAMLMRAYNHAITSDATTHSDARQLLCEAEHLLLVLTEMAAYLENRAVRACAPAES